jgi:hypothetical protein
MFLDDFSTLDHWPCGYQVRNHVDDLPALSFWDMTWVDCHHPLYRMMEFTSLLLTYQDAECEVDPSILRTYQFSGWG